MVTENDLIRYKRQISYPDFGEEGQKKLKESQVVVAGLGGLGCAASAYLACAGVGHITLVDYDCVELGNLNRQILYYDEDIGKEKPLVAASKLSRLNPSIEITPLFEKIIEDNVRNIIKEADVVIDGMDNLEGRFAVNFGCVSEGVPFIHGGISGLRGEITTIVPGKTPCFACIFPILLPKQGVIPVFGVTPALIATLQVAETIKLLTGLGNLLLGKMLYVNGVTMHFAVQNLAKDPTCRVCGVK